MAPPSPAALVPILTLRLSHPNFLDAVLTNDGQPVYSLETVGNQTTMLRCNTQTDGLEQVATIQWPEFEGRRRSKDKDAGAIVIMRDSSPISEADFFKTHVGVMSASRKFHVPGQDRALRWRKVHHIFECTSPTSCTPIAQFEPANLTSPAKIQVYVHDLSFQRTFNQTCGVNTILLDLLVTTALLLVTHRDSWRSMPLAGATPQSASSTASSPVSPISPITPFTSSPSPSSSSYGSHDSWYRSGTNVSSAMPSHHSHSYSQSHYSAAPVVRPPSHRPRTSPSTSTGGSAAAGATSSSSSLSPTSISIRRSASTYVRQAMMDDESSPVLDIRPPPLPAGGSMRSQSSATQLSRTTVLRLHVPSSPLPPMSSSRRPEMEVDPASSQAFLKIDPADVPPPYEEIEWTVRLRAPRHIGSSIDQ